MPNADGAGDGEICGMGAMLENRTSHDSAVLIAHSEVGTCLA
jgi:hypothetical protein